MTRRPEDETLDLIDSARLGESQALDALIRRYLPALRAFVRLKSSRQLRDKEGCSDLVQTACRQALQHIDEFEWRGEGSFRNWLFSFAMSKILNKQQYYRAAKREVGREIGGADTQLQGFYGKLCTPSRNAIAREEIARVEGLMDLLPEDYREVILLARILRLDHSQIAERMARSEGAVRVLLSRAMARLATLMTEE